MGKIFDALEKSKSENTVQGYLSENTEDHTAIDDKRKITLDEHNRIETKDLNRNLITLLRPWSIEAEQFKMLKTNVLFPASGKPPRVIMVTSAIPGDGKSFVSANMAISISQNIDDHVLLVDCDLRIPVLHKHFGLGKVPGLSEHLSLGVPLSKLICKTKVSKLSILPGGTPPHNPAELLTSEQMSAFIRDVRAKYSDRYVIIDSAPPQLTAEGNALARLVDAIIIVVKYRGTPRKFVKDLIEDLGKEKFVGVVINQFDMKSSAYYGLGKYDKYSKYYGMYKKDA